MKYFITSITVMLLTLVNGYAQNHEKWQQFMI